MDAMQPFRLPSPLTRLRSPFLERHNITFYLKRDDLIHLDIPGNKWRKLKYNLEAARRQGYQTLLTFGGAYSNHLRATAAAGKLFGFRTIGIVRGEEHLPLNWSLAATQAHGMTLHYLDRETYRRKHTPEIIDHLCQHFGNIYVLPEGGSNALAVKGCAELPAEIDIDFDIISCAVGTGATLAGIAAGIKPSQRAIGISVVKGGEFLTHDVARLQREAYGNTIDNWHIETGYHFGGYARTPAELIHFAHEFKATYGIAIDTIYVAKMLYGVFDMITNGYFETGTTIIATVTGLPEPDHETLSHG